MLKAFVPLCRSTRFFRVVTTETLKNYTICVFFLNSLLFVWILYFFLFLQFTVITVTSWELWWIIYKTKVYDTINSWLMKAIYAHEHKKP